jgi:hypothetical protein
MAWEGMLDRSAASLGRAAFALRREISASEHLGTSYPWLRALAQSRVATAQLELAKVEAALHHLEEECWVSRVEAALEAFEPRDEALSVA